VAIRDRLKRLEANNPRLCEEQPCMRIYCTQSRVRPDGTQELIKGEPPPDHCATCPHLEDPPINHIDVVPYDGRPASLHDEGAAVYP
jgi:hypothetical protein